MRNNIDSTECSAPDARHSRLLKRLVFILDLTGHVARFFPDLEQTDVFDVLRLVGARPVHFLLNSGVLLRSYLPCVEGALEPAGLAFLEPAGLVVCKRGVELLGLRASTHMSAFLWRQELRLLCRLELLCWGSVWAAGIKPRVWASFNATVSSTCWVC